MADTSINQMDTICIMNDMKVYSVQFDEASATKHSSFVFRAMPTQTITSYKLHVDSRDILRWLTTVLSG